MRYSSKCSDRNWMERSRSKSAQVDRKFKHRNRKATRKCRQLLEQWDEKRSDHILIFSKSCSIKALACFIYWRCSDLECLKELWIIDDNWEVETYMDAVKEWIGQSKLLFTHSGVFCFCIHIKVLRYARRIFYCSSIHFMLRVRVWTSYQDIRPFMSFFMSIYHRCVVFRDKFLIFTKHVRCDLHDYVLQSSCNLQWWREYPCLLMLSFAFTHFHYPTLD